ncbi:molybdopterin converting factor, small subunit [Rivularia sp. PCC 7116]|nr:molybdopterin converting factor, small subunit [Rivularia sp. PCC 7116]
MSDCEPEGLVFSGYESKTSTHSTPSSPSSPSHFPFLFPIFKDMSVKVLVPTALQKFTNNQATLECNGSTITELFDSLEKACPGIKARLCDESGKPRRFLNLYVNSEDIRFLDGAATPLKDGDEVSIVPAVAGG